MNLREKIKQANKQDKIHYIAKIALKEIESGKVPECIECWKRFCMDIYDKNKDKFEGMDLIYPDISIGVEMAWRLYHNI